jgi:hypothetical protein
MFDSGPKCRKCPETPEPVTNFMADFFDQRRRLVDVPEIYSDGMVVPRTGDSGMDFSQPKRVGTAVKRKKKKTTAPPPVDAEMVLQANADVIQLAVENISKKVGETLRSDSYKDVPEARKSQLYRGLAKMLIDKGKFDKEDLNKLVKKIDPESVVFTMVVNEEMDAEGTVSLIPEIPSPPELELINNVNAVVPEAAAAKKVKVKVEPQEVIAAAKEPESDVDSVADDTEDTQVLDAALDNALPKIK